jgi:hypothetical protein
MARFAPLHFETPRIGWQHPGKLKIAPRFLACYTVPLDSNGVDAQNEGQSALTEDEIQGPSTAGCNGERGTGMIAMMQCSPLDPNTT